MSNTIPPDATVVAAAADHQLSTTRDSEVVILGLEDGVSYGLNAVGARIWKLVQTPRRVSELLDHVAAAYNVSPARAEADVQALLADLAARRLVRIDLPGRS